MQGVAIRRARRDDARALAAMLARAYEDDPLMRWLIRREPRARRMRRFFEASLPPMLSSRRREVWTTDDRAAIAVWAPPGKCAVSTIAYLPHVPRLLAVSVGAFVRSGAEYSAIQRHHPKQRHWYLEMLGTEPERQRSGIATALLDVVLSRCDSDGVAAWLETQNRDNVPFYEGRGFEVVGALTLPMRGPRMWLMLRNPRG